MECDGAAGPGPSSTAAAAAAHVPSGRALATAACNRWKQTRRAGPPPAGAALSSASGGSSDGEGSRAEAPSTPYSLEQTRTLVETAMLAAVSGLAYLLSTILKLETSLGYFLPLPVVLAAMRGGGRAGWRTMSATCFLLVVLLGPLRAASYLWLHGLLAATLGSLWKARCGFWTCIAAGAAVRMLGQFAYLLMSSVMMNENMWALMLSNIYNMLDQISASLNISGAPSPLLVSCMVGSLLLVNSLTYNFLVQLVYRMLLGGMGYDLGSVPPLVAKYLYAGAVRRPPPAPGTQQGRQ
ncbi:hypothetical protein CHLRE_07g340150v5 [Chlamydomonas reinhardtii]|nr:uncharacterized protein CHLRE_07g340150v5 [Chlamydomonas reinhardtii]XP_042922909.1 uncharacterized protein CHLRE_07g340150v5 [Chlamydomonas reinhardtii]PNW81039.1 hypothetical protein CHLRE_07g340150v5 [Chlamydomonas reinhardtii]PNW81041.1 hypothetical protein CHLRE_07g340150v5 [Chlamydomonas reinhardtii]